MKIHVGRFSTIQPANVNPKNPNILPKGPFSLLEENERPNCGDDDTRVDSI